MLKGNKSSCWQRIVKKIPVLLCTLGHLAPSHWSDVDEIPKQKGNLAYPILINVSIGFPLESEIYP